MTKTKEQIREARQIETFTSYQSRVLKGVDRKIINDFADNRCKIPQSGMTNIIAEAWSRHLTIEAVRPLVVAYMTGEVTLEVAIANLGVAEQPLVTIHKGGTGEHTVPLSHCHIHDLWHLANAVESRQRPLDDANAKLWAKNIREVWRLAHALKRSIAERDTFDAVERHLVFYEAAAQLRRQRPDSQASVLRIKRSMKWEGAWIVLARYRKGDAGKYFADGYEYVTWEYNDEVKFVSGHYFTTCEAAETEFETRS